MNRIGVLLAMLFAGLFAGCGEEDYYEDHFTIHGLRADSHGLCEDIGRDSLTMFPACENDELDDLLGRAFHNLLVMEYDDCKDCIEDAEAVLSEDDLAGTARIALYRNFLNWRIGDTSSLERDKAFFNEFFNKHSGGLLPYGYRVPMGMIYYTEGDKDSAAYWFSLAGVELYEDYLAYVYEMTNYVAYMDVLGNAAGPSEIIRDILNFSEHMHGYMASDKYSVWQCFMISAFSVLLIAVLIMLLLFFRKRFRKISEEYSRSSDSLEQVLEEKISSLDDLERKYKVLLSELRRNEKARQLLAMRVDSIKSQLEYASDYESGSEGKFYENFKKTLCVVPSDDSNLNEIIATLDFLTGGMSEKLSAEFPSLTKRELCYCLLLVSGFSRNSIRIAMGHGKSNSIYNMRSKIREKLELSDVDSLDGFLKGFGDIGDKSA